MVLYGEHHGWHDRYDLLSRYKLHQSADRDLPVPLHEVSGRGCGVPDQKREPPAIPAEGSRFIYGYIF